LTVSLFGLRRRREAYHTPLTQASIDTRRAILAEVYFERSIVVGD